MDDDLKSASNSLADEAIVKPAYKHYSGSSQKKQSHRNKLIVAAVVLVAILLGFGAWKIFANRPEKTVGGKLNVTQASVQKIDKDIADSPSTETYTSAALSLSFKYPKTWKVSESAGGIRVESPQFSYPALNLGSVDGLFRVYIRQGARPVDGKYIGDGLAIKPSEKLVYTQPSIDQRKDTLLSSFGSTSPDIFTFFLIAGNFQLNKGDTLGPDYGKEPDAYIIAGGYASTTSTDDLAMNSVATDYYSTTNAYKQALAIVGSLQFK